MSIADLNNRFPRLQYGVAIVSAAFALLARLALDPYLHDHVTYVTFFAGVALAAWFGGVAPGLLCSALSLLAADWFFVEPFARP